MARFRLKIIKNGAIFSKIFDAPSKQELENKISREGLIVTEILEISSAIDPKTAGIFARFSKISEKNLSFSFRQMAMFLDSSMPLDFALTHCANTQNTALKEAFHGVLARLKQGKNLTKSFRAFGKNLSEMHYAMIFIGEQSGRLVEIFVKIAADLDKKIVYKKKLKKALFYPATVLFAMIGAFLLAILLIIPEFSNFFAESQIVLPFVTRSMISIEFFVRNFGIYALILLIFAGFLIRRLHQKSQKFRLFCDRTALKIPFFGKIILNFQNERYFSALFLMQSSGLALDEAIKIGAQVFSNAALKMSAEKILQILKTGKNIESSTKNADFLDAVTKAMLSAGEKSGNLDAMLLAISRHYDERTNELLDRSLLYLEPALNVFMAALVLYLALGIFLPIWSLGGFDF